MQHRLTPAHWLPSHVVPRSSARRAWCVVVALALWWSAAEASTLRVAWDDSTDAAVVGYKVSMGTQSGVYTIVLDVGTRTIAEFPNLSAGVTYYFVVQAYDRDGNLSPPSAEVAGTAALFSAMEIMCPVPTAASRTGAPVAVSFTATASGGVAPVAVSCSPRSGSLFPVGVTPVVCTARDSTGAVSTCETTVVVVAPAPNPPSATECPRCPPQ
jgi:hypothetical protein